jgi:hypothetical protein
MTNYVDAPAKYEAWAGQQLKGQPIPDAQIKPSSKKFQIFL